MEHHIPYVYKKIGIISIHYGVNFGSSLQAFALYHFICSNFKQYYVEVINYIPKRFRIKNRYHYTKGYNPISFARWCTGTARSINNNCRYMNYLRHLVNLSPKLYSVDEAKKRYRDFSYFIAGSDQIWNSDYNQGIDPMYYLQFAPESAKKIAYAASCGKESFTEDEWKIQRDYLQGFHSISLREQSTVQMMHEHGIKNCEFVLDPTYLLSDYEWAAYEQPVKGCPDHYLLIYFLDTDGAEIVELAKHIAHTRGLKTVLVQNGRKRNPYQVDYIASNCLPDEYIWLFRNASFVVTNSFHGVSFSINLERQFVALRRDKYNSRLDSILGAMGLRSRCVAATYRGPIEDINYDLVNRNKSTLLSKSIDYLRRALEG